MSSTGRRAAFRPKLGIQGPAVSWQDPWAGEERAACWMRTGTGSLLAPQDPTPEPVAFLRAMRELGAEFYVHHAMPDLAGQSEFVRDAALCGMEICLGNEYGNINGPYTEGTNRWDIPDEAVLEAARSGLLTGLLYDEPEHLQINAGQYRKDGFYPHWGATDGLSLAEAGRKVAEAVAERAARIRRLLEREGLDPDAVPLISEQVFPVMFHLFARSGMIPCPKIMKESFQPLQLSAALGAAKQYGRQMWICADLWGPDTGAWFTRAPGFPGHSPAEFASALRLGYFMGPDRLFAENVDALLHYGNGTTFRRTEFGDVWDEFAREFVPSHPLRWSHGDAECDIAIIHADDGNYGQNERLLGNRTLPAPETTQSVFQVWHLLSRGTIPPHGSCMHIPGYDFPRHRLKADVPAASFPLERGSSAHVAEGVHPLFYPSRSTLTFDETVSEGRLGRPGLIVVAGSRISEETLAMVRDRAERGATVVIADWLVPRRWADSEPVGSGRWLTTEHFLEDDRVRETLEPFLPAADCWTQRFGEAELRIYPKDSRGFELEFEVCEPNR
ncbi:hypothetical protein [Cohnella zeiphila]|uniref:Uncharacterized protein n=1 Tax=Cohnella zeiphila TaxID=2761120 RepID=A0A7X0VWF3_9BACL|nr:hypothetical protein [Cohnella zeiphila]MBB6732445.1 hypothetical protein [Cohnella zeiphila]